MTCHRNYRKGLALCFVLVCLSTISLAQSAGVLLPQNVGIGEQASGSIVLNPNDWQNVAGIRVIPFQLPNSSANAAPNLSDYLVEINPGQSFPASGAFSFKVEQNLKLMIKSAGASKAQPVTLNIPFPSAAITAPPQGFTTSPIAMGGLMQTIRGPFQGDASNASVLLNNLAAPIIAESQSSLFYLAPENTPAGSADVLVKDKDRKTHFTVAVLSLQMSADKLNLLKGESTAFHVLVKGAESLPPESWWGGEAQGGDVDTLHKLLPNFHPPTGLDRGYLVLIIENLSSNVVMSGGQKIALTFTYPQSGKYGYDGTLTATKAGGFVVNGTLIPFLRKQPGTGASTDGTATSSDSQTATALRDKAQQLRTHSDTLRQQNSGNTDSRVRKKIEDEIAQDNSNADKLDQLAYDLEKASINAANGQGSSTISELRKDASNQLNNPVLQAKNDEPQVPAKPGNTPEHPGTTSKPNTPGTTEKPQETPHTPTTPEIPKTPTSTPQTPDNSTTNKKKEEKNDCPQRGKGCVALVIDFSADYSFEFDMSTVSKKLSDAGCDTDYIAPKFKDVPKESLFSTPTAAEIKAAQDHNQAQWDSVNDAEKKHREKVAKGVEIAIEITNGHGGEAAPGLPCGDVEPNDWRGSYLRRDDFHQGNYKAANKNVCSWFTADLTCYGGLTPKVVDELENLTTATCKAASTIACGNHAGWEADGSMSSAKSTDTCTNGSVWWQSGYVKEALDAEIKRRAAGQNKDYSTLIQALNSSTVKSTTARYTDHGYAKDHPPVHARGGYGEKSSNEQ